MLLTCDHNEFIVIYAAPATCPYCKFESTVVDEAYNRGYSEGSDDGYAEAVEDLKED